MNLPIRALFVLLGGLVAASTAVSAQESQDVDQARATLERSRVVLDVVRKMETRYRDLGPFEVSFEQSYESSTFGQEERDLGTMHVEPPSRMIWDYDRPAGQRAVLDGTTWWLVVPEDKQVFRRERAPGQPEPLTDLLAGTLDVLSVFSVRPSVEPPLEQGGLVLELIPKETREDVELALIELNEVTGDLRRLELFDPLGNRVIYRLGAPRRVARAGESAFDVQVPDGFDLVAD